MQIPELLKLDNLPELKRLAAIGQKRLTDPDLSAVCISRVSDGAKAHILAALPVLRLVVASDEMAAKSLARRIQSWGVRVDYLPFKDDVLLARSAYSGAAVRERMRTLSAIADGEAEVVVTSADSLLQRFPSRELVERFTLHLKKEDILPPDLLCKRLAEAGYTRQDMASSSGEFARRGDIVDICTDEGTYRLNYFDDLIENIKRLDASSMLSVGEVEALTVVPTSDILFDEATLEQTSKKLSERINMKNAAWVAGQLNLGACSPSCVWALPFFVGATQTILQFFGDNTPFVVAFDEPKVVGDKLELLSKEFDSRVETLLAAGEITEEHRKSCISYFELKRQLLLKRKLSVSSLMLSNPLFEPKLILQPANRPVTKYYLDPQAAATDMKAFIASGTKAIFACGSTERAKGVRDSLNEMDVPACLTDVDQLSAPVCVTALTVQTGVIYPSMKVAVIGTSECVGKTHSQKPISHNRDFIAPKAGDYVVHRVHGIGLCEGVALLKTGDFEREYVVLKYRDGDTLYVATDQMDNLQKFVGEEHPKLNKLGGKEFEREKEKVKKAVRSVAINLMDLYARREKQKGYTYSPDTVWQRMFEDDFEYEETADQLKALDDIKRDMEQGKIMDRLLVGDVGFGKTEVAFRAMFKTVMDGKQAVLLAPTTILARQHYENLVNRLSRFDIKCGLLTRLQSKKENAATLKALEDGTLYMVIATHKVLSKDVRFKDLGLLVLDEEQRFGVEHKETLKQKYPLVNVLTLSATPIPRTLNMSLSGMRDISMLETPPQGRLPVQTYVVPFSEGLIADAISREVARGGQTLVLLNDIDRLEPFAKTVCELVPNVRVICAHGQMPSEMLEQRISAFYDKRADVLVATTIIENGIDLPDANTLIVVDSGNFGLSQLYQLRGRVGRRGVLAHAYFTVSDGDMLSHTAQRRLQTLLENTEIGSGFRVALADLSIRGAGTLLGAEQSGHIEKVGYEMYLELLDEAISEIKTGEAVKPIRDVDMKVDIKAYIRDGYVSSKDKLRIYKQIAGVSCQSAKDELIKELSEIYGPVEQPLVNLIGISLLKNLAAHTGASKIIINSAGASAGFYDSDIFKNEALMQAVAEHKDSVVLTSTIPPMLLFDVKGMSAEQKLQTVTDFFSSAQ